MQSAYFSACVSLNPELLGLEEEPHAASDSAHGERCDEACGRHSALHSYTRRVTPRQRLTTQLPRAVPPSREQPRRPQHSCPSGNRKRYPSVMEASATSAQLRGPAATGTGHRQSRDPAPPFPHEPQCGFPPARDPAPARRQKRNASRRGAQQVPSAGAGSPAVRAKRGRDRGAARMLVLMSKQVFERDPDVLAGGEGSARREFLADAGALGLAGELGVAGCVADRRQIGTAATAPARDAVTSKVAQPQAGGLVVITNITPSISIHSIALAVQASGRALGGAPARRGRDFAARF